MATTVPDAGPPADATPGLDFAVEGVGAPRFVATPTVRLDLRVTGPENVAIETLLLECQVRIAARRRPTVDDGERDRLRDLFGAPEQWAQSMQSLLWANVTLSVPRFAGTTTAELDVPCSYDFEVSAARYLAALDGGDIPLEVLFSGTVLWTDEGRGRRLARIPLDREAEAAVPVAVWREAMDRHFPGTAWLRLSRDRFARLQAFRAREAHPTWDSAIDALLAVQEEHAR